jgi:hypothetical protein
MTARTPVTQAYAASASNGHRVCALNVSSCVPHRSLTKRRDDPQVSVFPADSRSFARGAVDPLVVGVVSLVVYALHGYQGVLDRDLGAFVYGGEHVAHGIPPYVGIFNTVGPLADAVPGFAIWCGHLFGVDPILSARVFFTVLSAGCCVLLCVLARDLFGARAAGFVAPAVFLNFERFIQLASDGPREKTTMLLFLLAALILICRRRWLGVGVFTALATLTWQPSFAVAATAVVVAILIGPDHRGRAAGRFLLGGAIPSLVTIAYFASQHALHQAWEGFVLVNVLYTSQPSVSSAPGTTWHFLWVGYHATLLVGIVGLVLFLVTGVTAVRRLLSAPRSRADRSPRDVGAVALAAAAGVGVGWTLVAINGAPDLFEMLPFGALGITAGILWLVGRVSAGGPSLVARVAITAVVAATLLAAGANSVLTRNDILPIERADVGRVLAAAPPGAGVLSISAPEVLAIAGRTNPRPVQIYDRPMEAYLDKTWPDGMTGYTHSLIRMRPTLIAVGDSFARTWPDQMLTRDYWSVGRGTTWRWYLSRTAGRAALLRLREANDSVPHERREEVFE